MIEYKNGDLLKSKCGIICHQVNIQGIMGGGIALQIARNYYSCEKEYKEFCNAFNHKEQDLLGKVLIWENYLYGSSVANCFSQKENFETCYESVEKCLTYIRNYAEKNNLSVGIPYKYGCGIANAQWEKVESIIKKVFEKSQVKCEIWKLE